MNNESNSTVFFTTLYDSPTAYLYAYVEGRAYQVMLPCRPRLAGALIAGPEGSENFQAAIRRVKNYAKRTNQPLADVIRAGLQVGS